ncbi:MAG: ABC transporter permease, partial [Gemmatimonadales bacterium]
MALWRQLTRGLRILTDRTAADRDVADEVRHFLDESIAAGIARGLPPEEARRAAHLELGSVTAVREEVRNSGWEMAIETAFADLRYAGRRLRRSPGFTLVSVLTLALGIGASTAIFSVIDPILIASLPYPQADRITAISDVGQDGTPQNITFGTYLELAQRSRSFTATAVFRPWQPALIGTGEPEQLRGQRVGAGYFHVLGVSPALGRDFAPPDDRVNGPAVVILSDGLWRRRFNADPGIVGEDIRLDGTSYLVLGVMPRGLDNVLAPSADIWTPLQFST